MSAPSITKAEASWYCACGGMLTMRVRGKNVGDTVEKFDAFFTEVHQGPGHGPATVQQAAAARRRAEDHPHDSVMRS